MATWTTAGIIHIGEVDVTVEVLMHLPAATAEQIAEGDAFTVRVDSYRASWEDAGVFAILESESMQQMVEALSRAFGACAVPAMVPS